MTDELFGFVNVPNGVWIDEDGMIVRPAEPACPPGHNETRVVPQDRPSRPCRPRWPTCSSRPARSRSDPEGYVAAMIDDWVEHGAESRYALSPDEVVAPSQPRGDAEAIARGASSSSAQHLHAHGDHAAAIPHWPRGAPAASRQLDLQAPGVGRSRTRLARAAPTCTTATGSRTSRRSAPRTTTRRSSRSARMSARVPTRASGSAVPCALHVI